MSGRQVRSPSIEVEANYWSLLYQVKGLRNPHKSILYVYIISINFKLVIGIFYSIQPKYDHVSKTVGKNIHRYEAPGSMTGLYNNSERVKRP